MKWLTRSMVFLGLGLSGCVSDDAIYANYGDLACGGISITQDDYWPAVVNFGFDETLLTSAEKVKLKKATQLLLKHPMLTAAVVGSADPVGSLEYNKKLADERAEVVANYFTTQGISLERLIVFGLGERASFVESENQKVNRVNRRVNLILLDDNFNPVSMKYSSADQR